MSWWGGTNEESWCRRRRGRPTNHLLRYQLLGVDAAAVHFGSWRTQIDWTVGCDDILISVCMIIVPKLIRMSTHIASIQWSNSPCMARSASILEKALCLNLVVSLYVIRHSSGVTIQWSNNDASDKRVQVMMLYIARLTWSQISSTCACIVTTYRL